MLVRDIGARRARFGIHPTESLQAANELFGIMITAIANSVGACDDSAAHLEERDRLARELHDRLGCLHQCCAAGGGLTLFSSPGAGAHVRLVVPLERDLDAQSG
jgi:hypothetical protein